MKSLVRKMEEVLNSPEDVNEKFYEQELHLHTQLAKISANPIFEWFAVMVEKNALSFSQDLIGQSENPEIALDDWRNFIKAVEQREITKATMIMRSHVFRFGEIFEDLSEND